MYHAVSITCYMYGSILGYKLAVNWDYTFLILLGSIGPTYIIGCFVFTGCVQEFA